MMIDTTAASAQQKILQDAGTESPVRQVRVDLHRRAREWGDAAMLLDAGGDEDYVIDLVGSVAPSDRVLALVATPWSEDRELEACPVVRVIHRDGQATLHLSPDSTGRDSYVNMSSAASPVVVRR